MLPNPKPGKKGARLITERVERLMIISAGGYRADMPVIPVFCGEGYGKVTNSSGLPRWMVTHDEDEAPNEMGRRAAVWYPAFGFNRK